MRTIALFLGVATLVLYGLLPVRGLAQSLDQRVVVDDAGILDGGTADVEAAATSLIREGAEVRVRTILSYRPSSSLDAFEADLEQRSPSWTDQSGLTTSNLIVLIISLEERETGLYYGDRWASVLDDSWERIVEDIMNPRFAEGDFAGGTVNGLAEVRTLVRRAGQTPDGGQASGQSPWWIVPVVVLAIIGVITGLVVFFYLRKTRAVRMAARQKAMLAKQAAASGINEQIEAMQMLEIKVNVTAERITAEEANAMKGRLQEARRLVDRSSEAYSNLSHSAGDPENPKLGEAGLGVIEAEYRKVLDDLGQAREVMKRAEADIAAVQQAIESFPGRVAETEARVEQALSKQEELNKAGYRTSVLSEMIAGARSTLEQAKAMSAGKRVLEGVKHAGLADDRVKAAIQAAEGLPREREQAERAIEALASRIEQTRLTIDRGRDDFERVSSSYADTTWASIQGNGTEAENRLDWASDALDDARTAVRAEHQEWPKAMQLVASANEWLTEADSLMKSISVLEENLTKARRDAPAEIDAAQADISRAWDYINRYDEDIRESLEDDLRAAESKNRQASDELAREKPDYFEVCKSAREANASADRILVEARNEHETAERLRIKAASAVRDASASLSIARKYIEDHHQVVKEEARTYLGTAQDAYRQSETTPDTDARISLALKAESAANRAYAMAREDVNNSWQRPVPGQGSPQSSTPGMIIIPGMPSPTTGRTSGGSSPWGSRRSSGPSPSGGIRRGGGSSGWSSRSGGGRGGGSRGW